MLTTTTELHKIEALQFEMAKLPQIELKTSHYFADGMYCRVLERPKDALIVGKVHKKEHFYIVSSGAVVVTTDAGVQELHAPAVLVSKPGTKRAVLALEDSVCITVHRVSSTDLTEIEKELIEDDDMALFDIHNKIKFDSVKFRELTVKVIAGEKVGFWSDWTSEQQALYTADDWEAFSRSRGYSEEDIKTYGEWRDMIAQAKDVGINPFKLIVDLTEQAALKNIALDTRGEILKSSHAPFEDRTKLCRL